MAPSDSVLDAYWQTPPIARTLATITFTLSISIYFFGVPWYWFFWHPEHFWQIPPEIWRFVTTFLVTPPKLGILFDTYFIYRYTSEIESGHPRFPRKEDVLWYIMFVSGCILVSFDDECLHTCTHIYLPPYTPLISARIVLLHLLLSRFLEMRKITPALRPTHSFAKSGCLRCRHGGMSNGWLL
jgi:hypothetical protein